MKRIPLTRGKVALVDDDVYDYLMQWTWYARKSRSTYYATRKSKSPQGGCVQMHRVFMGAKKGQLVDHANGNGLDNRICNSRRCNHRQNMWNQCKMRRTTSSTYKGVSWQKQMNKWEAYIRHKGKHIYLGCYREEDDAARAYDAKARELFGVFARPNFRSGGILRPLADYYGQ